MRFSPWIDVPGQIDNDQEHSVAVFSNYAGKITHCYAEPGETVHRGDPLYALASSDLAQAVSAWRSANATLQLTTLALTRAQAMLKAEGMATKDLEQAQTDRANAEANFTAALQLLKVMGISTAQANALLSHPEQEAPALIIRSPMDGLVIDRQAAEGLLVQPGNIPAPYTLSQTHSVWLDANVPDLYSASVHIGTEFSAQVAALPGLTLTGHLSQVAQAEDPVTHTLGVRAVIANSLRQLHPGMLASLRILTAPRHEAAAVPAVSVVHEPDGSTSVWVSQDHQHFQRRTVQTGLEQQGVVEIVHGLAVGDPVVTLGAINLSNMLLSTGDD